MLDINDFSKKQIIVFCPAAGDKLSYRSDNLLIRNGDGEIKYQHTCYRIFMLLVIGDTTITTGLIRRAKKYGFAILFMSYSFRLYAEFNAGLQGNTCLHKKQYEYVGTDIAAHIVKNKICNQRVALNLIRNKTPEIKEGIAMLDAYISSFGTDSLERMTIVGIEGNASKVYFPRMFNTVNWQGRKPRVKHDYLNCLMDIGYTVLFNFVDCILQVFGFDVYKGVLHTEFYMRKSLVCDLVEPFRPIIDWKIRKGINLGQFKKDDFLEIKGQWQLEYNKTSIYCGLFMEEILKNKEDIFLYIRAYYRAFMKGLEAEQFPEYSMQR